jgi:hypothetical protein
MKNRSRKRILAFERLETKASPASLLIAIAPLDPADHEQVEPVVQNSRSALVDASTNWQYHHSVSTLLQFVEEQTRPATGEPEGAGRLPSQDACESADAMMKLDDPDLLALVRAEQFASPSPGGMAAI